MSGQTGKRPTAGALTFAKATPPVRADEQVPAGEAGQAAADPSAGGRAQVPAHGGAREGMPTVARPQGRRETAALRRVGDSGRAVAAALLRVDERLGDLTADIEQARAAGVTDPLIRAALVTAGIDEPSVAHIV
jgi:hypothetical protein